MNFTGNIGSDKSSNGPYISNTDCTELVVLLRPKVISMFNNNEIISFLASEDIFDLTSI